jgi:hypothetical protein
MKLILSVPLEVDMDISNLGQFVYLEVASVDGLKALGIKFKKYREESFNNSDHLEIIVENKECVWEWYCKMEFKDIPDEFFKPYIESYAFTNAW